jgi:hypothetical protein
MGFKPLSPYDAITRDLPASVMLYPDTFLERIKYLIWRVYTPFHPFFRDLAIRLHIVSIQAKAERWGSRQNYLLGHIAPHETFESVIKYLISKGFYNHFVAWEDDGEVVSLRYMENFSHQYHLRIFDDGEVRGHFEYTPECHPLKHYYAEGFEERRDYFLNLLGDKIVPQTS